VLQEIPKIHCPLCGARESDQGTHHFATEDGPDDYERKFTCGHEDARLLCVVMQGDRAEHVRFYPTLNNFEVSRPIRTNQ